MIWPMPSVVQASLQNGLTLARAPSATGGRSPAFRVATTCASMLRPTSGAGNCRRHCSASSTGREAWTGSHALLRRQPPHSEKTSFVAFAFTPGIHPGARSLARPSLHRVQQAAMSPDRSARRDEFRVSRLPGGSSLRTSPGSPAGGFSAAQKTNRPRRPWESWDRSSCRFWGEQERGNSSNATQGDQEFPMLRIASHDGVLRAGR